MFRAHRLVELSLAFVALAACSDTAPLPCLDCGAPKQNAALARRLALETGLPICDQALLLETTTPAQQGNREMPEYEVQVHLDGYCPALSIKKIDALMKGGNASFVRAGKWHVVIEPLNYKSSGYNFRVWQRASGAR